MTVCLKFLNHRACRPRAHTARRARRSTSPPPPPPALARFRNLGLDSTAGALARKRAPTRSCHARSRTRTSSAAPRGFTGPLDDSLVGQAQSHHARGHVARLGGLLRNRDGRARLVPHLASGASRGSAAFARCARVAPPVLLASSEGSASARRVHARRFKSSLSVLASVEADRERASISAPSLPRDERRRWSTTTTMTARAPPRARARLAARAAHGEGGMAAQAAAEAAVEAVAAGDANALSSPTPTLCLPCTRARPARRARFRNRPRARTRRARRSASTSSRRP